jgi:cob(I)alamin adenosyltransferase
MVRLNRIYTRTGDDGTTGLVDGSRLAKCATRVQAIGEVDELNSMLGLARCAALGAEDAVLAVIQNDLFDLGADIATPGEDFGPSAVALRVVAGQVAWLEAQIDRLNQSLRPLDSFILPGGSEASARVHLARAVARRAERATIAAAQDQALNPHAVAYLNRLSDFLFVLARCLNDGGAGDVKWVPGASRQR